MSNEDMLSELHDNLLQFWSVDGIIMSPDIYKIVVEKSTIFEFHNRFLSHVLKDGSIIIFGCDNNGDTKIKQPTFLVQNGE